MKFSSPFIFNGSSFSLDFIEPSLQFHQQSLRNVWIVVGQVLFLSGVFSDVIEFRVRWCRNQGYYEQKQWRGTWAYDGGVLANDIFGNLPALGWQNLTRKFLKTG